MELNNAEQSQNPELDEEQPMTVVDEQIECDPVTPMETTYEMEVSSQPDISIQDRENDDTSLLIGPQVPKAPLKNEDTVTLNQPESLENADPREADNVLETQPVIEPDPDLHQAFELDLSCSETILDEASPIPENENSTQDDMSSTRTPDVPESELDIGCEEENVLERSAPSISGAHTEAEDISISSEMSTKSLHSPFNNFIDIALNEVIIEGSESPNNSCVTTHDASKSKLSPSQPESPQTQDTTETMDVDNQNSAPEIPSKELASKINEESSELPESNGNANAIGPVTEKTDEESENKAASSSSPERRTPVKRKIPVRNTRSVPMLRKRRRKRLMTRQRQTPTSAQKKQNGMSPLGKRTTGRDTDNQGGGRGETGKPSPKRIVRKRKLGSGKQEKSTDQQEEAEEPPILIPKRSYLSTSLLVYFGTMYRIGDVIQVMGDDDLTYYAQILRFITDDYCEKFVMIRWLVPRQDVPMKQYHSTEFNPLYFAPGPFQEEPLSMRDIEFVMRAPRDLGPGQIEPTFNKCGEHAIIFNANVPDNTLTSISNCKL